jgi:hypothetical protein
MRRWGEGSAVPVQRREWLEGGQMVAVPPLRFLSQSQRCIHADERTKMRANISSSERGSSSPVHSLWGLLPLCASLCPL